MENKIEKIIVLYIGFIVIFASCSGSGHNTVSVLDTIPFDTVKVEFAKGLP